MPRLARNRFWASRAHANSLHHVTNRGVDRRLLFRSPADRIVFLATLAAFCLDDGILVHSFCLMTDHFHVLAEDPRGMLSHMMLRLQTSYARYVRDTSGSRGSGHVFGDRFFSRPVGSARDYRAVVDYILLNPLRCVEPLATSAESYLWSSASIHISEISSSRGCAALIERFGGLEALLAALPPPGTKKLEMARRHRLECLASGEWLEAGAARQGRTGEELRRRLIERMTLPGTDKDPEDADVQEMPAPSIQPVFRGHEGGTVLEALERMTGEAMARGEIGVYALWRFGRQGRRRLAAALGTTSERIWQAIERIRTERRTNPASHEALSRLEWRMTFALGGAPWRV